jgi:hypothetical protein
MTKIIISLLILILGQGIDSLPLLNALSKELAGSVTYPLSAEAAAVKGEAR